MVGAKLYRRDASFRRVWTLAREGCGRNVAAADQGTRDGAGDTTVLQMAQHAAHSATGIDLCLLRTCAEAFARRRLSDTRARLGARGSRRVGRLEELIFRPRRTSTSAPTAQPRRLAGDSPRESPNRTHSAGRSPGAGARAVTHRHAPVREARTRWASSVAPSSVRACCAAPLTPPRAGGRPADDTPAGGSSPLVAAPSAVVRPGLAPSPPRTAAAGGPAVPCWRRPTWRTANARAPAATGRTAAAARWQQRRVVVVVVAAAAHAWTTCPSQRRQPAYVRRTGTGMRSAGLPGSGHIYLGTRVGLTFAGTGRLAWHAYLSAAARLGQDRK
eukprot:349929-Chlamydomonas_euryale.AAC.2